MLTIASKLSHYDIVLFAEPLYPQNILLLRYLKFRIVAPIVLYVGFPSFKSKPYYLLIRNKFPVLIVGEITRPFAESITTSVGLVSPGVDIIKLYPLDSNKKWDLLYIGSLFREKGVWLLLQAMKLLQSSGSPIQLKIIHPPSNGEKFYYRYIREKGLDNVNMERATVTDHFSVYNSARVFVYPGISYNRVLDVPMTILEASACGLPVVCTSLYRHIELPNITFTDPDPTSLAGAILQAGSDWTSQKCDQTLAIIRKMYSLGSMSSMAESFFTEVIARKKKQRTQLKM
jgi:glycosyltransferase involved in cell wall biosynthesis